jgi:hypothetical protein
VPVLPNKRSEQQFGEDFPLIVSAIDDLEVRAQIEEGLPRLEAMGWHISEAFRRIWAGERDWHSLGENLRNEETLVVLRVLERLSYSRALPHCRLLFVRLLWQGSASFPTGI